ncbi:MAG: hypothetical protein ACYS0D_05900 [Planctomycetota bacterium]|jgi:hypothetical protein
MKRSDNHRRSRVAGLAALFTPAALAIAASAAGQGIPACDDPDPGAGNCLVATPGIPGCQDQTCCKLICGIDFLCCDSEWDSVCADQASQLCDILLNDDCADALPIAELETLEFNTTSATTDGDEEFVCLLDGAFQIHKDIWYQFTPTSNDTYIVSICNSSFDSVLSVYEGCGVCPPDPADDPIDCDNDGCFPLETSELTFNGVAGQCYLIRLGGQAATDGGEGSIVITSTTPPPPNDECAGRETVGVPSITAFETTEATDDSDEAPTCGTTVTAPGVWYSIIGTGNRIIATTCDEGTNYDTKINVYCNTCDELVCVTGNDNQPGDFVETCDTVGGGNNRGSTVEWCSEQGTEYLILVQGASGDVGEFVLLIGDDATPCQDPPSCEFQPFPPNDACADAIAIGLGETAFSTLGATTDGPAHAACHASNDSQVNQDVWFTYTADFSGQLVVSTCGLVDYDSRLAVYGTGDCLAVDDASLLTCNDDDPIRPCGGDPDYHSTVIVDVESATTYTIRVGGFGRETGSGSLSLAAGTPHPACPGSGDCSADNGTPGCNDEACCNTVCLYLPECCDMTWDATCAAAAGLVCLPPPVCTILDASCQLPDQLGHGVNDIVAATSDANSQADISSTDDFSVLADGEVTEVCWWGVYADTISVPSGDCSPGTGDFFTITYYENDVGVPGAVHAGPFLVSPVKNESGLMVASGIGPLVEFQYTVTHPAVTVSAGFTYWIEVLNDTSGTCFWFWSTSPDGNAVSYQADPIISGYSAGGIRDYDLAFCVDVETNTPCPWDCSPTPDGVVSTIDLLTLIGQWGDIGTSCDIDGGGVATSDLLALLGAWGQCP